MTAGALTETLKRRWVGMWADPGKQTVGDDLLGWLASTRPSLRPTTAAS